MPTVPTWTPRVNPVNNNLFSTQIMPPDPRYTPFTSDITEGEDGYYIFQTLEWGTPFWATRS